MIDFPSGYFMPLILTVLALTVVVVTLAVLACIGLYRIAVDKGSQANAWMAWIPYANLYLIGYLAKEVSMFGLSITGNLGIIFLLTSIAASALSAVPVIGVITSVALLIFQVCVSAKVIEDYYPEHKYILGFFSAIGFFLCGLKIKKAQQEQ
jgi:hypothetical protein